MISDETLERMAAGHRVSGTPDALSMSHAARLVAELEKKTGVASTTSRDLYLPILASLQLDLEGQKQHLPQYVGTYLCSIRCPETRRLISYCIRIDENSNAQPGFRRYGRLKESSEFHLIEEGYAFFVEYGLLLLAPARGMLRQMAAKPAPPGSSPRRNGILIGDRSSTSAAFSASAFVERISSDPNIGIAPEQIGHVSTELPRNAAIHAALDQFQEVASASNRSLPHGYAS